MKKEHFVEMRVANREKWNDSAVHCSKIMEKLSEQLDPIKFNIPDGWKIPLKNRAISKLNSPPLSLIILKNKVS